MGRADLSCPPVGGGAHPKLAVQAILGATTRRHPTTWASSSWPAPCSGTAVTTGFEIVSKLPAWLARRRAIAAA